MKAKLTHIPFHCLFPQAPERFANYVVTVPVYDPSAIDRTEEIVRRAMRLGINAALACERGNRWRPRGVPPTVCLPVATEHIVRRQNGSGGMKIVSLTRTPLGFRRFKIKDLATMPFQKVKSRAIPKALSERLRLLTEG